MKKLHIAFISPSDPSIAGGVQEHILHLSSQLRKLGHSIDIFGPEGSDKRFLNYHAISTLIDIPIPGGAYSSINILDQSFNIEETLNSKKYDLVHIHEPYFPIAMWNIIDKIQRPAVATFHTAWDDMSILNILNGIIPLFNDQFSESIQSAIFVSQSTRKVWKNICASSVLQTVIPNAVDIECFKPKIGFNKIPTILFVARLVSRKGVLHLLKAAQVLLRRNIQFTIDILGTGKEKDEMLAYIRSNQMNKLVKYRGEIKGKLRYEYFTNADIFCAPYVNEAAPLTILEAISSGLPIVGFMNNSFKESLSQYPARDLLVEPKNDAALARALESLILDRKKLEKIKKWCVNQRPLYSWESIAKKTEDTYYKTIQNYEKKII